MVASMDTTGNPSSVHAEGRAVRAIVERAREEVAQLVNAKPSEVVFTSGATEANNWVMAAGWDEICVSAIEHDSVLAPARASGARLASLPVSASGIVDVEAAMATLDAGARALGARAREPDDGQQRDRRNPAGRRGCRRRRGGSAL